MDMEHGPRAAGEEEKTIEGAGKACVGETVNGKKIQAVQLIPSPVTPVTKIFVAPVAEGVSLVGLVLRLVNYLVPYFVISSSLSDSLVVDVLAVALLLTFFQPCLFFAM